MPSSTNEIKSHSKGEWTNKVKTAIELENKRRLIQDCHKIVDGASIRKTKTAHIVDKIEDLGYRRTPANELMSLNKKETKTLLIARYGMLECGKNFQGTRELNCIECNAVDNESHRLNFYIKYCDINFRDCNSKVTFEDVYSNDPNILKNLVQKISTVWNVQNANGTMGTE